MSSYSAQLREEQQAVSRAYDRLDALRAQARSRLDTVRAAGSHGSPTQRTERDSFATMYEDRLTQLRAVEDRLVFGRLDDVHGAHRYIGRIGLSDEDHEPILTDWRADAARPFYEATPSNHGDIVMRRHITLSFREVVGVEDEVLDVHSDQVGEASSNGTLTGEGALLALLASLSSRRTGKMTDIVATIQGEQDRIIRADLNQAVVVQGGPGTGKTAVALHRAAYLLYTHRRALQRSGVLVVGPSSTFLHYIDQVLPSLGETGVVSRTIADPIPGIIATAHDDPYAAKLKGERRMAKAIANAVAARERVPSHLPVIRINGFNVPMVRADIEQAIADAKAFCDEKGIQYIEKNGTTTAEVQMAAEALVAAGVKAVFTPTDNTIMTAELSIYETFTEAGVMHFTGADSFALNGAFVGYGVDYVQLGEATADMVAEILCDGKSAAEMPYQTFDNGIVTINTETAAALGFEGDKLDALKEAFKPYCTEIVEVTTAENFS